MKKVINEQDMSDLKQIAVSQIMPIPKMVKFILDKYPTTSEDVAQEWSQDILDRAGAELGFQTKYSSCCE